MLPGKLCIGILEEDNPLKSYFRLKPLLVEVEGKYVFFDGGEAYPEEGCIRIVPDKNESSHFKARMRRMGRYCVLDLRQHTGENDKIRPNKNYSGDETERNAHIVYSDVVREPAENLIFEILNEEDGVACAPGTPRVLRGDGLQTWAYTPPAEGEEAGSLAPDGLALLEEEIQRVEIPGFPGETLRFAIKLPSAVESVVQLPAPRQEAPAPAPRPQAAPAPAPAEAPQPAPQAEAKPWISHDLPRREAPAPREHLSPLQQALAAQSGLNPRRNRSLQEIIEEKWRHSRVDQLGHPVPANATGQPVENPLERALDALRSAWHISGLRGRLIAAIADMPEFSAALEGRRQDVANAALKHELEDLEAERLKTLAEIDKLRRDKAALRETFKQEIRSEEASDLQEAIERTRAAQQEQKKYEAAAAEARQAAEYAQDAFAALNDGRFEEKLKDFALTSRAAQLLTQPETHQEPLPPAAGQEPGREEWIVRLRRAFAQQGLEISDLQAANLLVCAALSDSLMLSGRASSDKELFARALAAALGAEEGACLEISGDHPFRPEPAGKAAITLIHNANGRPGGNVLPPCSGLKIALLNDGGCPVSAEALERGFLLRLAPQAQQTPWKRTPRPAATFGPVAPHALKNAFVGGEADLPVALDRRLQRIRDALAGHDVYLSRHCLDLMWHYCAAMLPLNLASAGEILDLAFAQKALPCILAEAPVACLAELKQLLSGMPHSLALLDAPLPIQI